MREEEKDKSKHREEKKEQGQEKKGESQVEGQLVRLGVFPEPLGPQHQGSTAHLLQHKLEEENKDQLGPWAQGRLCRRG